MPEYAPPNLTSEHLARIDRQVRDFLTAGGPPSAEWAVLCADLRKSSPDTPRRRRYLHLRRFVGQLKLEGLVMMHYRTVWVEQAFLAVLPSEADPAYWVPWLREVAGCDYYKVVPQIKSECRAKPLPDVTTPSGIKLHTYQKVILDEVKNLEFRSDRTPSGPEVQDFSLKLLKSSQPGPTSYANLFNEIFQTITKEQPMTTLNPARPTLETITYICGVPVQDVTDAQIWELVRKLETDLQSLGTIQNRSKALTARMATLKQEIDALIAISDARQPTGDSDPETTPEAALTPVTGDGYTSN